MIKSNAWVDEFQPKTLEECFLPKATRQQVEAIITDGDIPSMFFCGPSGIGKTTVAKAICEQLDLDHMLINASLHGNIETVRTDIASFAATIAFNGKKKVIILDEGDGLTAAAQASLRAAINEYTNNCSFIITANYRNKIIDALISRFVEVDFLFSKDEMPILAVGLYKFIIARLEAEKVEFEPKAVQEFIKKRITKSSDIRKLLIDAQKIARTKVFTAASYFDIDGTRLGDLIPMIKTRDFNKVRTWVGENSDITFESILKFLYNNLDTYTTRENTAVVISILNEGQKAYPDAIDKDINTVDMIAQISQATR